ncbi:acyltransferase family protein [Pseudomonas laurentiana]
MNNCLKYQPHVDGLRALAVALVIFCHLNLASFAGGFVGVDVFFVISGYLISKLIIGELQRTGDFKFAQFYLRRARRILPALLVTCAWTLTVATLLFSPQHLDEAGASALHAVASLSNIYFWLTSDYFALASETQPFLHTWSLSVEEQFYLIWPLLLLLTWRVWRLKGVICSITVAFLVSLTLSVMFTDISFLSLERLPGWLRGLFLDGNSLSYYLTPFRVFEFAAGSAVIALEKKPVAVWASNLCALTGGLLIVWTALCFDARTPFPHYNALLPVVGTMLLITYAPQSLFRHVLANRVACAVGKLSYSLYLTHWPVIVFYGYVFGSSFSGADIAVILAITFTLSYGTYRVVETPFRQLTKNNVGFLFGLFASTTVIMLVSSNIWATNGWIWRLDADVQKMARGFEDRGEIDRLYSGSSNCPYEYEKGYGPFCQTNPNAKKHVWLVGDSHARHLAYGLARAYPDVNFKFYKNNCRFDTIDLCYEIDAGVIDVARENKARIISRLQQDDSPVIIAQTWIQSPVRYLQANGRPAIDLATTAEHVKFVRNNLEKVERALKIKNPGRRIIVFGDVPRPRLLGAASPIDCLLYPLDIMRQDCSSATIPAHDQHRQFNQQLAALYPKITSEDTIFINPFDVMCEGERCLNIREMSKPLYTDSSHLSSWGSQYLIQGQYNKLRYGLRDFMAEKNYYAK